MHENALLYHVLNNRNKVLHGMRIVSQESETEIGRIDLVAIDSNGRWVIIEVETVIDFRTIGQVTAYAAYFAQVNDIEVKFLRKIIIAREAKKPLRDVCTRLGIELIVLDKVNELPRPRLFKPKAISSNVPQNLLMFSCNRTEYALLLALKAENMRSFRTSDCARLTNKPVTSMPFYLNSLSGKGFIEKEAVGQYRIANRVWSELDLILNPEPAADARYEMKAQETRPMWRGGSLRVHRRFGSKTFSSFG